jgi:glucokinase
LSPVAIGIDLGGSNVRACLLDRAGNRLAERMLPLPQGSHAEAVIAMLTALGREMRDQAAEPPLGLGLGLAGALDGAGRLVAGMTNVPALAGRPLADEIGAALGLPAAAENDARAAMLGEARFGAARSVANALTLTLGTGIGGGLLLDGRVREGPARMAGEVGLTLMPAGAEGGFVPLEDLASPGGLRRTLGISTEDLGERAGRGEPVPAATLDRIAERLAVAIVNAHVTLDLEMVVLAGGMVRMGEPLMQRLRAAFARLCPPAFVGRLAIETTRLGPWAGAMGAAALFLPPGAETGTTP